MNLLIVTFVRLHAALRSGVIFFSADFSPFFYTLLHASFFTQLIQQDWRAGREPEAAGRGLYALAQSARDFKKESTAKICRIGHTRSHCTTETEEAPFRAQTTALVFNMGGQEKKQFQMRYGTEFERCGIGFPPHQDANLD